MKALSVKQPWAHLLIHGGKYGKKKTIETRTWWTNYRGPLVICASKKPHNCGNGMEYGKAIGIVDMFDCRRMVLADEPAAQCGFESGLYAWCVRNARAIKPVPVRGQLGIFDLPEDVAIEYVEAQP